MNEFKTKIADVVYDYLNDTKDITVYDEKLIDAILDAMLVPTEAMIDAGADSDDGSGYHIIGRQAALECWLTMITEAKRAD